MLASQGGQGREVGAFACPIDRPAPIGCRKFLCGRMLLPFAWLLSLLASGCVTVPVSVSNPIPGMTTIAVAPFFNLSAEPTVDGRRFALAYYSELQKTAHYQVLPVGVVETAIRENDLDLSSPVDTLKLAQLLDVDAVVVGAVTEYNPYYPPQMGLHIQWYSNKKWMFLRTETPPIDYGPDRPPRANCPPGGNSPPGQACPPGTPGNPMGPDCPPDQLLGKQTGVQIRAQSPSYQLEDTSRAQPFTSTESAQSGPALRLAQGANNKKLPPLGPSTWPPDPNEPDAMPRERIKPSEKSNGAFCVQPQHDAPQPVMSYTRFFDAGDKKLTKLLKGYYHLRGDFRSGGWEAYMQRSDDFLRFTAHVMIVEMLSMHGGALEKDVFFDFWK